MTRIVGVGTKEVKKKKEASRPINLTNDQCDAFF